MNISGESKTKHNNSHEMRFMEQNEVIYNFEYFLYQTKKSEAAFFFFHMS